MDIGLKTIKFRRAGNPDLRSGCRRHSLVGETL
jgi:hypothetical protein